jgi:hypothetical protein
LARKTDIGPFNKKDTGIVPQSKIDQPPTYIDSGHGSSPTPKEAVRETPCGGPHID